MDILKRLKAADFFGEIAKAEQLTAEELTEAVETGSIVIPFNPHHENLIPTAIGKNCKTKVSASIGMYHPTDTVAGELEKAKEAVAAGADTLMDLSVRGNMDGFRKILLTEVSIPVGTLPLYQALSYAQEKYGSAFKMEADDLFEVIEKQAADGVDFMAVHPGITLAMLEKIKGSGRIDPLVSFGGSHLIGWMVKNQKENPLYEQYDRLLDICKKYGVTLALADAMRPGCLADSLDGPMVEELVLLGEMVKRAQAAGVQVMVEGPGHVPLHHVEATMKLQKALCNNAPYYILGTLATDVAPGYDHITGAIGGALAGAVGADFLCYLTPAEHLGLPLEDDVKIGVRTTRIAAQIADVARGNKRAWAREIAMAKARVARDLEGQKAAALYPDVFDDYPEESHECPACALDCCADAAAEYFGI